MEITKTFGSTFGNIMRAKFRAFVRRSEFRYALGVALLTFGLHAFDASLTPADIALKGLLYFVILCGGVLILQLLAATIQARIIAPWVITFTENEVVVNRKGKTVSQDWDWILAAEESPTIIALLVQKRPRLEMFLPKTKLDQNEYNVLRGWLVLHGKLGPKKSAE